MTDSFTDEIFELGALADRLVFPVSRLLVDTERFPNDVDEPMARRGMGAVYTRTHDGRPLKSDAQREELMHEFYQPHHQKLEEWVEKQLVNHGRCLIIDGHSFPSQPLPCDLSQKLERPDFCIGTAEPHSPPAVVLAATRALQDMGYLASVYDPYEGTVVPLKWFGTDARVASIMVEVNRKLYMDELTGTKSQAFDQIKKNLTTCLAQIVGQWLLTIPDR